MPRRHAQGASVNDEPRPHRYCEPCDAAYCPEQNRYAGPQRFGILSRPALCLAFQLIAACATAGFFDNRDQASLEHVIGERMLQLEKAFDHGPMRLAYRELVRYCCHRKKPLVVPHSGMSGVLKGVS